MINRILYILMILFTSLLSAQKQNNNWINSKSLWDFNNTSSGDFAYSQVNTNRVNQGVSTVSDKNTGALLFYTNGVEVYNKNHTIMSNGAELFGNSYPDYPEFDANVYMYGGIFSAQGSLIVPVPGNTTQYYVFSLVGDAKFDVDPGVGGNPQYRYGMRYAKVDMSLNGGLGGVISKNNMVFSNTNINSMTTCPSSDGGFWVITQNDNGNYLSYKISTSGVSSTPIVSNQTFGMAKTGLKISPNNAFLFDIGGRNLFDFNNTTGNITFNKKITPIPTEYTSRYLPCSAEFSEDSNVIYFISYYGTLGTSKTGQGYYLCKYLISSDQIFGFDQFNGPVQILPESSMQRHPNGKIYIKTYGRFPIMNDPLFTYVPSGSWYRIDNPNSTALNFNNFQTILLNPSMPSGFTFPQLVPTAEAPNPCPDVLYITTPVTSSQIYQAGNSIFASSAINDNLNVEYKAGLNVNLNPGFFVKGELRGNFKGYISPCTIASFNNVGPNNIEPTFAKTNTVVTSEVKIYPNPASTVVKIDAGKNKLSSWTLYDLSGKNVLNGNDLNVPVENLPKSAYLLMIKLDNGNTVTKKVIVQ